MAARADRAGARERRRAGDRYMREEVEVVRRRQKGIVVHETAADLIAAEYRHTTARGVAGAVAPDPQLHSHVVISRGRPSGRPDRCGGVAADLPGGARGRRLLPRRAGVGAARARVRDRAGDGQPRPLLRARQRSAVVAGGVLPARPRVPRRRRRIPRQIRSRAGARGTPPPEARGPPGQTADDASRSRPRVA